MRYYVSIWEGCYGQEKLVNSKCFTYYKAVVNFIEKNFREDETRYANIYNAETHELIKTVG